MCPLCRQTPVYKNLEEAALPCLTLREVCEVKAYFNRRLKGYASRCVPEQWRDKFFHALEATTRDIRNMVMFQCVCGGGVIELGTGVCSINDGDPTKPQGRHESAAR